MGHPGRTSFYFGGRIRDLAEVSILDLFWLILKFLAALGLVCLLGLLAYLICRAAFVLLRTFPSFVTGKASTTVTVSWVLVIVVVGSLAIALVGFLNSHTAGQLTK
jgi:hypothetical protein